MLTLDLKFYSGRIIWSTENGLCQIYIYILIYIGDPVFPEHKHIRQLWLRIFCVKMPAFSFLYSSCVPCLEVRQENLALEWNHQCHTVSWKDVTKCSDIYKSFDCQGWLDALVSQRSVYCFSVATVKESVTRLYVLSRKGYNKSEIPSLEILQMKSRALTCSACFFNAVMV